MKAKKEVARTLLEVAEALETGQFGSQTRVALTTPGSEHGEAELRKGAEKLLARQKDIELVIIGEKPVADCQHHYCECLDEAHDIMENLFVEDKIDAAVTLHYNFPMGVATVGRVKTPATGDEMLLATTTGTSGTSRVEAMVKNAIAGQAAARALGIEEPEVGILNVDGARKVEQLLTRLKDNGYPLKFATSARSDGGSVMRGNDLLLGSCDVMVCDTLTGNILMKLFSARESGGDYEVSGFGYGPGVGKEQDKLIGIISRASGAPVVAGALEYLAASAEGGLLEVYQREWQQAKKAGLQDLLTELKSSAGPAKEEVTAPDKKQTDAEIAGIDVLDIETAKETLWQQDIYAETGMGCAGPVVMIAPEDEEEARMVLQEAGFIS